MIAAGLCMMGGCFAQDENTAAADTYWAAESIQIATGVENVVIADSLVLGGDSQSDVLETAFSAGSYGDSYLISGLRPIVTANRYGLLIFSGVASVNVLGQKSGNTSDWQEALNSKVFWWARNGLYKRGDSTGTLEKYQLEESAARYFRVGSALASQNRFIYNVNYSNARTGVKAQWVPMVSTSGTALFETVSCTLAEQ